MTYRFSAANRANLERLADYLESLPRNYKHFDMKTFVNEYAPGADTDAIIEYALHNGGVNQCGTVACAVGHGPAAGFLFSRRMPSLWIEGKPNWFAYTARFFLSSKRGQNVMFDWLFGEEWVSVDNHHYGAAARIRYALAGNPLPEDLVNNERWDSYDCMDVNPSEKHRRLYRDYDKRTLARRARATA